MWLRDPARLFLGESAPGSHTGQVGAARSSSELRANHPTAQGISDIAISIDSHLSANTIVKGHAGRTDSDSYLLTDR